jgi:hypothetical protein
MLVSRKVFEAIQPPWWSFGVIDSDRIDHDLAFCQRIREAGFQIYADLETIVDHMTPMVLRPVHHPNGSWAIEIRDRQGRAIEVQTVPPFVEKEQAV